MKLLICSSVLVALFAGSVNAAKEARVTRIIRDVKLLPGEAKARPAAVNDRVDEDTGVRTGVQSRSELTFPDLTITRLGANSVFSFDKGGRSVDLEGGSILLRVPKDSGGASIRASAVSVAVTGTTLILETQRGGRSKLIVLEGGARLALVKYPAQRRNVSAGQMLDVPAGATRLPQPRNIDLNQVMKTHPLIVGFAPLPSRDLIANAARGGPPDEPVYQGRPVTGSGPTGGIGVGGFNIPGIFGGGGGGTRNPRNPGVAQPTNPRGPNAPPQTGPAGTKVPGVGAVRGGRATTRKAQQGATPAPIR